MKSEKHQGQGKWVVINPNLNFDGGENYSPEVWIVTDEQDSFDLPPELSAFDPELDEWTGLRKDAVKVWERTPYDTTHIYTFMDNIFEYVIHETIDGHSMHPESYAITRVRHHSL